ncbi:MAG: sucrase ferredoxin [Spirulinaceae cyanobacterium]
MTPFFCANLSRQRGEDIIGSAPAYQTYIMVECPYPWTGNAFESPGVPDNLRALVAEVKKAKLPIRFLLTLPPQPDPENLTQVLIFQRQPGLAPGYRKQEIRVRNISEVAPLLNKYLTPAGRQIEGEVSKTRDFFVCTHGSHDKCCSRYGYPFFRQGVAMAEKLGLKDVRFWQVSHIGGHRFAPTLISLPDGRYYGALDEESLQAILLHQGDITCLSRVYRGWGLLPRKVQVLERELILRHGWQWLHHAVSCRILKEFPEQNLTQVELLYQTSNGETFVYRGDITEDESKTLTMQGSCQGDKASTFIKYTAINIRQLPKVKSLNHLPSLTRIEKSA